ncbi:MAG: endonuclease domain-containing protein [Acidobacteriota bacterium]
MAKEHAREMRKAPTAYEQRLWSWLRDRRFGECKFRRQHPLGPYILDFYCVELKLAIEVDGKQHDGVWTIDYEDVRTKYLSRRGIDMLRIPNELLTADAPMVAEQIRYAIATALTRPSATLSRSAGEGR